MYSQYQEVKLFISEQTQEDVESCILWSATELLYWIYVWRKAWQITYARLRTNANDVWLLLQTQEQEKTCKTWESHFVIDVFNKIVET